MNPWIPKAVILAGAIVRIVIRAPYGSRSARTTVARSYKTHLERLLLAVAAFGYAVPFGWSLVPVFTFADYALRPASFFAGLVFLVAGIWTLNRSHADLSTNWSPTLELRESHELVTRGIYRDVRHPMYTSFLLYGIGVLLVVPNWFVGPSNLVSMAVLIACRLPAEERMMLDRFGDQYSAYARRTKRLIPWVW